MRLRTTFTAGLALAAALAVPASAAAPVAAAASCAGLPKHSNFPVVDAAGVLDAQRGAYLTGDLMRFAMESDVAIVAATVPDMGGDDISSYARRLFDCWGVGDAGSDRGVLILAAMRERRVRIELGRGLANDIDRTELERAVNAMSKPLQGGDEAGALRAAAVEVAKAVGRTLPDIEKFVSTNGAGGLGDLGLPEGVIPDAGDLPGDAPPQGDQVVPGLPNPFRSPENTWIPKAVVVMVVIGIVSTFARAVLRGGMRLANVGQSSWRGGFPTFGGGARGWGDPELLNGGHWTSGSSAGSRPLASPGGGGGSSGSSGSSGGSGGSFGGGSSGGGGASGSW